MDAAALTVALVETFGGYPPHPLVAGAAVVDGADLGIRVDPGEFADARFEIGSIGKTMTGAALSSLVLDGTLRLDDEIGTWLDAGENADITIEQLLTHTSGLPRLAPNHAAARIDPDDPYASFGPDEAEAGLRMAARSDGGRLYSNFGLQLVGLVLVRAAGVAYEVLLRERLWGPLGMHGTSVTGEQAPIVQGYAGERTVPPWRSPLPGPGLVTSTAHDMLAYLQALLVPSPDAVGAALDHAIAHGLVWSTAHDGHVWHNGGTAGARSMLSFDRESGRGAFLLTNAGGLDAVDHAVALAARGADPRSARPQPVGPEFEVVAAQLIERLVTADWDGLRAGMDDDLRAALTTDVLAEAWTSVMGERGAFTGRQITALHRTGPAIEATVELRFDHGEGWAVVHLSDDAQLIGLRIG